jgi:uncharacterized protein involved in exopolysaccharide biosynthesis
MKSEMRFYASILLKRLPIVVVITGLATAAAVYVAMTLPATYRAEALLLVESPQIPTTSPPRPWTTTRPSSSTSSSSAS